MNIPICPKCKVPTTRMQGMSTRTLMNFTPIYDSNGVNVNPDRNITSTCWKCLGCGTEWIEKN